MVNYVIARKDSNEQYSFVRAPERNLLTNPEFDCKHGMNDSEARSAVDKMHNLNYEAHILSTDGHGCINANGLELKILHHS